MDEAAETAISHAGEIISVSAAEKSEEEIREYAFVLCKVLSRNMMSEF